MQGRSWKPLVSGSKLDKPWREDFVYSMHNQDAARPTVKALRTGRGQLQDAYVDTTSGELWLKQAHISPYEFGTDANHDPLRPRKLLLNRAEIHKILSKVERKGYTLIPLAIYLNPRGLIKVRIALAEGKTLGDKRESLREREQKREMDRVRKGVVE